MTLAGHLTPNDLGEKEREGGRETTFPAEVMEVKKEEMQEDDKEEEE